MKTTEPRAVFTFHTTADAMAAERVCRKHGLPGRLIPAPRELSADCGIAWRSPPEAGQAVAALLHASGVEYADMRVI